MSFKKHWNSNDQENLREWLHKNFSFKKDKLKDLKVFAKSLTHVSVSNDWNYEKLEFVGDRVIGVIVSDYLFKTRNDLEVGDLHDAFVSFTEASIQALFYEKLKLSEQLKIVPNTVLSDKKKGDVFEAFMAAVYYNYGINSVKTILNRIAFKNCEKRKSFLAISKMEEDMWNELRRKKSHENDSIIMMKNSDSNWVVSLKINKRKEITVVDKKVTIAREELIKDVSKIINDRKNK